MKHRFILIALAALFVSSVASGETEFILTDETKANNLPFSDAVRVDNMLYLSGAIGVDPATDKMVEGGIEPQTHQIFANMKRVLDTQGTGFNNIVKCTAMLADIAEWPKFNSVYVTYFPGPKPARSAFAASGLALGARVELECWARL